MSPPTGAENHGANTLPVRGNAQVEAPEGPLRRAPARWAENLAGCMWRSEDEQIVGSTEKDQGAEGKPRATPLNFSQMVTTEEYPSLGRGTKGYPGKLFADGA